MAKDTDRKLRQRVAKRGSLRGHHGRALGRRVIVGVGSGTGREAGAGAGAAAPAHLAVRRPGRGADAPGCAPSASGTQATQTAVQPNDEPFPIVLHTHTHTPVQPMHLCPHTKLHMRTTFHTPLPLAASLSPLPLLKNHARIHAHAHLAAM